MDLPAVGDARRTEGQFPAANLGPVNGDGQTQSRSDAAMVKEIVSIGLEVVDIENPSAIGNGDSELMFFVAFSQEREEAATVRACKIAPTDLQP